VAELEQIKKLPEHQFYRWFEGLDIGTVDKQVLLGRLLQSFLDATLYIDFERVAPKRRDHQTPSATI
jgi:hypothetical protein